MEYRSVLVPVLLLVLSVWTLFSCPEAQPVTATDRRATITPQDDRDVCTSFASSGELSDGELLPVLIEHTGEAADPITNVAIRTDIQPDEEYELLLPSGGPDNQYSALCSGGYFLVGVNGAADFGSVAGTISFWIKWHDNAPNGRPWGQETNFEIRWSSDQVVLDWGSDITLTGQKSDWIADHWYFLAFTWDDAVNQICVYWADEYGMPELDTSTSTWLGSVVGFHAQNNIMNSRGMADQTNGHIDAFRYFNRSRSLQEIQTDYRSQLNLTETGLAHTYSFEGNPVDDAGSTDLLTVGAVDYTKDVISVEDWWQGNQIDIDVEGLEELGATLGGFDSGVPGTNADWTGDGVYHPDGWLARRQVISTYGVQRAAYVESDDGYVTLQNEGYALDSPTRWRHYNGTVMYWYQQVDNTDLATDFLLDFNYLYESGPIGTSYRNAFSLRIQVRDGQSLLWEWSVDPTTLSQRSIWYSVDHLAVAIPTGHTSLEIRVALEVRLSTTYISLYQTSADLGGDPSNGKFVTLLVDDFSLVLSESPSCSEVGLSVILPSIGQMAITGIGGQGHLTASHESWSEASILFRFSSTTPVAFIFSARISHMSRFENSSPRMIAREIGVSYLVKQNADVSLAAYAYLPAHDEVTNLTLRITHPRDWTSTGVSDALGQNVSSDCYYSPDTVEVYSNLLDKLGWWEFRFASPNYAREITLQAYRDSAWSESATFRNNDLARAVVAVGTETVTPAQITGLSLSWILPDETIWYSETLHSSSGGILESTSLSFGAGNSTVGQWSVWVSWNNGTEVAFGEDDFEIRHSAMLTAETSIVETSLGDVGTGAVSFTDVDNGEPIVDPSASVVGNWSESELIFRPNLARMTWEAGLNTTQLGTGSFTVTVNGSLQFYDVMSCSFVLRILTTTVLGFLDNEFVLVGLGETYSAQFAYTYHDDTGIEDANMSVIMWTGPENGLTWQTAVAVPSEPGRYAMNFTATASGTYHVFVSASKEYHQTSTTSFYLIVGQIETQLVLLNGSAATTGPDAPYRLVIRYLNATGFGLPDANVQVMSVTPSVGLAYTLSEYLGNGTYSLLLIPEDYGAFSVLIGAELADHDSQYSVFTITVSPMSSILRTVTSVGSVAIDRTYTVYFTFLDENLTGLEDADVFVISVDPVSGVQVGDTVELGNGNYSAVITPATKGTYELLFRAVLAKYQNGTAAFTLIATEVPTVLVSGDESTSAAFYIGDVFRLTLLYQRSDTWANVTMASFTVSTSPGLICSVYEVNGSYMLTMQATITSKWQLVITASREDYRNGTLTYQLEAMERPTMLIGGGLEPTLFYGMEYVFHLQYQTHDEAGVIHANVTVPVNPAQALQWHEVGEGYYEFELTTNSLGSYELTIRFAAYGYAAAEYSVQFEVVPSETTVECHALPLHFFDTRNYVISICYKSASGRGIEGAEIAFSADIRSFVISMKQGSGRYNLTLVPSLGEWNATFYLTRSGYMEGRFSFIMTVGLIPIVLSNGYQFNETYSATEGRTINLRFAFAANDTGEVLSDARVTYRISSAENPEMPPILTGLLTSDFGVYTASIVTPAAGLYIISVLVERSHCQSLLLDGFLVAETDAMILWTSTVRTGTSIVALTAATIASVYIGRTTYLTRRESRMRELLELRGRMDDAERTIGLLVLHNKKGLPVFSRIVKGGFDKTMVSGFISAISTFREELAMEERLGLPIPISEVITAVRTRTLICALLTVEPPSKRQIANLQEYAESVMDLFGDSQETADVLSQDLGYQRQVSGTFAELFNKKMDGPLLVRYTGVSAGPLPDRFSQIPPIVSLLAEKEFSLGMLAMALIGTGIDERRSLGLVIEAAETGLLIPAETSEPE